MAQLIDGTKEDQLSKALGRRPNVRLLREERQEGFSKAYNFGACAAIGKQIIWLNDDCEIISPWLETVLNFMETHPNVGVGGIVYDEGRGEMRRKAYGWYSPNFGCTPARVWQQFGGFDEIYHSYGAETDYCMRVMEAGYEVVEIPGVCIWHEEAPSFRETMECHRVPGRELFHRRWAGERVGRLRERFGTLPLSPAKPEGATPA